MSIYLSKIIASLLLPPGIILIALIGLALYLGRQRDFIAQRVLWLIIGLVYLLSINYVGDLLIASLESRYLPPTVVSGDVIVMLGGGATADTPDIEGQGQLSGQAANRLLTVARLQKMLNVPVIVSGGQVFDDSGKEAIIAKRMLTQLGVAADQVITEEASLNTAQNAQYITKIIEQHEFKQPILVTSAFHMERAILHFDQQNIVVQPFPTAYLANVRSIVNFNKFIPSSSAFDNSCIALHEYLGILAARIF